MDKLSPADITALLAQSRTRGGYANVIGNFATSGDYALDFMDLPEYKDKVLASVKNSVTQNVKKLQAANADWPELACVATDKNVFIVNKAALAAATA